jgi:hypothetical protein
LIHKINKIKKIKTKTKTERGMKKLMKFKNN